MWLFFKKIEHLEDDARQENGSVLQDVVCGAFFALQKN